MGLSYVYKNFSAQDFAIVPFNAHKQYNFTSASAASNQVAHFNTSYTSESILYIVQLVLFMVEIQRM